MCSARSFDVIINVHIPAVRNMIAQCVFDEKKCDIGIRALEGYHAEYDEEKKVLSTRPAHDWHSHAADAFRTFAVGYQPKTSTLKLQMPDYSGNAHGWMM